MKSATGVFSWSDPRLVGGRGWDPYGTMEESGVGVGMGGWAMGVVRFQGV